MANVVNLRDIRTLLEAGLEAGQTIDQIHADARDGLERLLCANVREFDGRMLRKTRDLILQLRYTIIASSPEAQELVEARVRTLNRALSEDETLDTLAPELAKVSVHFR